MVELTSGLMNVFWKPWQVCVVTWKLWQFESLPKLENYDKFGYWTCRFSYWIGLQKRFGSHVAHNISITFWFFKRKIEVGALQNYCAWYSPSIHVLWFIFCLGLRVQQDTIRLEVFTICPSTCIMPNLSREIVCFLSDIKHMTLGVISDIQHLLQWVKFHLIMHESVSLANPWSYIHHILHSLWRSGRWKCM